MKYTRREIMPFVWLTCVQTDKFKTGCLSLNLLTPLKRETAAMNACLPGVLRRGSTGHPDMASVAETLDGLYGARLEPTVRKKGEIQALGFFSDFPDDKYLPGNERLISDVSALMAELLLSPNTRGGLFLPEYVNGERDKLLEQIRARINDKILYAQTRLFELMCFSEDYAVYKLGSEDEAEAINYLRLTKHYKDILQSSPIEIFYCGSANADTVEAALVTALSGLPRAEPDSGLGTDIRMNSVEESARYFSEELDVTQGKLAIGLRLGECMEEPDQAAIRVFNAVYGGSITSKLFMNVRERLSLAYYASSAIDLHKGLLLVFSGIEFDKYNSALSEIFAQLDAVKSGDITDDEIRYASSHVASSLRSAMDSPGALEDFSLDRAIDGESFTAEELAASCECVTRDEIVSAANSVECDAVYFLRGSAAEDGGDADEA